MMKVYNPLTLNTNKDKPSFINDKGLFWLVDEQDDYRIFLFERLFTTYFGKFREKKFLLFYKDRIIRDFDGFEAAAVFRDVHKAGKLD